MLTVVTVGDFFDCCLQGLYLRRQQDTLLPTIWSKKKNVLR